MSTNVDPIRVGVISDTHGLLRPEAVEALRGSALVVHAGDIGHPHVLAALEAIAPVAAVRGNNDRARWAQALPERRTVEVGGLSLLVLHDLAELGRETGGAAVVITGHSHRPRIERRGDTLFLNPGSAGPRRFRLPVSVARLAIVAGAAEAQIVELVLREKRST